MGENQYVYHPGLDTPKESKTTFRPPPIDPQLRLKWGLALLGKEKAAEYLAWLRARSGADSR